MSLADPQSITVSGSAKSLAGVPSPANAGKYSNNGGEFVFDVVQGTTKDRFNRVMRFTQTKTAADPISSVNKQVSATVSVSINEPRWGFDDADLVALLTGLVATLSGSTYALVKQVLNGEV